MDLSLKGRRAVVGGSTQGIGKAAAFELALLGADVTLLARSESKLREVVDELPRSPSQNHSYLVADFDHPDLVRKVIDGFIRDATVHILVNNTGGPSPVNALDAKPEDYVKAFNNHLVCGQHLVQAVVPGMKNAAFGRIINVISTSVRIPIKGMGVSNTIRGAVASWAKTLSVELGPFGITVNNILPGSTETGRIESVIETRAAKTGRSTQQVRDEMIAEVPAGRMAQPGELGAAIAFLASPAAAYINGVSLPVDGGRIGAI